MARPETVMVTGAFSYTGRSIARQLIGEGNRVRTLTGHPERGGVFDGEIEAFPYRFDAPAELVESMRGATTLYNTYWIRFPHKGLTFEGAVANTRILAEAAREAGVRRMVHVSVSNCSLESPLPYYRGKALAEEAIAAAGISHAIIRPTLIFAEGDILLNNIAWMLRRMPVFGLPGGGAYRLQPVSAQDVARIALDQARVEDNTVVDAAGPDTMTFRDLVILLARAVASRAVIVPLPTELALLMSRLLGSLVSDVILTRNEIRGLADELLVSHEPALGRDSIGDWLAAYGSELGRHYSSEMRRHFR